MEHSNIPTGTPQRKKYPYVKLQINGLSDVVQRAVIESLSRTTNTPRRQILGAKQITQLQVPAHYGYTPQLDIIEALMDVEQQIAQRCHLRINLSVIDKDATYFLKKSPRDLIKRILLTIEKQQKKIYD